MDHQQSGQNFSDTKGKMFKLAFKASYSDMKTYLSICSRLLCFYYINIFIHVNVRNNARGSYIVGRVPLYAATSASLFPMEYSGSWPSPLVWPRYGYRKLSTKHYQRPSTKLEISEGLFSVSFTLHFQQ